MENTANVDSVCCQNKRRMERTAKDLLLTMSADSNIVDKMVRIYTVPSDWSEINVPWRNVIATPTMYMSPNPKVVNASKKIRRIQKASKLLLRGTSDNIRAMPPRSNTNLNVNGSGGSEKNLLNLEVPEKFSDFNGLVDVTTNSYVERNGVYNKLKICRKMVDFEGVALRKRLPDHSSLTLEQKSLQRKIQRDHKKEFNNQKTNINSDKKSNSDVESSHDERNQNHASDGCDQVEDKTHVIEVKRSKSQISLPVEIPAMLSPQSLPSLLPSRLYPPCFYSQGSADVHLSIRDHLKQDTTNNIRKDDHRSRRINNYTSTALTDKAFSVLALRSTDKQKPPAVVTETKKLLKPPNGLQHRINLATDDLTVNAKRYRASLRPTSFHVISPIRNPNRHSNGEPNTAEKTTTANCDEKISRTNEMKREDISRKTTGDKESSKSFNHYRFLPTISGKGISKSTMHVL